MSDNKSIIVKTILDKTGILKGIKEVQNWMKRNPLRLSPKVDMKSVEKEVQSKMNKINQQINQNQSQNQKQSQISQKPQSSDSGSTKPDVSSTSASSGSPPETSSSTQSGGWMRLVSTSALLLS